MRGVIVNPMLFAWHGPAVLLGVAVYTVDVPLPLSSAPVIAATINSLAMSPHPVRLEAESVVWTGEVWRASFEVDGRLFANGKFALVPTAWPMGGPSVAGRAFIGTNVAEGE